MAPKNPVLSDQARARIIDLLLAGKLVPGDRIIEAQLCHEFKVSRTPLREALIALERAGLLISEPHVGFTVKPLSIREAEELYPLLWSLEGYALSSAFSLVRTQVETLTEANAAFAKARSNPRQASLADRRFHRLLTELCRNSTLLRMIDDLRLRVSCYEAAYMTNARLVADSVKHHRAIIDAVAANDEKPAQDALVENWNYGLRVLVAQLARDEARAELGRGHVR